MATALSQSNASYELYRDQKLAVWALYSPKVGNVAMPYWQAMSDGYGRKVTVLAPTREAAIAKLKEYASKNERKLSASESDVVFTYGLYGLLAGGVTSALGRFVSMPTVSRVGALAAVSGLGMTAAGYFLKPKTSGEDQIVLDTSIPSLPKV